MNRGQDDPRPLYIRDGSGFVRGMNWWDVFVFNVLGYATGLSLATNPTILGGLYPNAQIYWVLIFGVALSICCGLLYGTYSAWWPRSGGDYVFISRTLHPGLGFVANWGFTWSQIYGIGVFSGWAVRDALSPALTTLGHSLGDASCVEAGKWLAQPRTVFAGGLATLVACLLVSIVRDHIRKYVQTFLFLAALLGTALMVVPFYMVDHAQFVVEFDRFMKSSAGMDDAYRGVVHLAVEQGLPTGRPATIGESFQALPIGFLIFFGFTYSVYVGGEVREPQMSQRIGIIGALVFGFVVSCLGMGRYYEVVGRDFNNAVAVVKALPNSPLPAGGSMIFFAGVLLKNPLLNVLMNFGSFLWFLLLPVVMTQVCVRNVLAWSFDRILPDWFAHVSSGNRSWHATVVVIAAAAVFLALDSLMGFPYVNYIVLFSVCFCVTGVAGLFLPIARRDLFEIAPSFVRRELLGIPLISIYGLITAVMFGFVLYSALTNTAFSGVQAGKVPHIVIGVVYASGVVVWLSYRTRAVAQGRPDPGMMFQTLPPE